MSCKIDVLRKFGMDIDEECRLSLHLLCNEGLATAVDILIYGSWVLNPYLMFQYFLMFQDL